MEAKPLKIVPHSDSDSPSVKLGLSIGSNTVEKPAITPAQLIDFQKQALIFKYIEAGLPVPLYLVLPVPESVATSSPSSNKVVGLCPQDFGYRFMRDTEPSRCGRTDGKKWRCSKDVVPGQKYCERHMHRGRQRSRKHVEASDTSPPNSSRPSSKKSNTGLSVSSPADLQLMTPSRTNSSISHIPNIPCSNTEDTKTIGHKKDTYSTITATVNSSIHNNKESHNNFKINCSMGSKNELIQNVGEKNSSYKGHNTGGNMYPRVGFSPNSVIQGYNTPCYYNMIALDSEPGRCRRTDGKKWRCSRHVVPDQKYCGQHMHRGTKRHAEASRHNDVPTDSTATANNACRPAMENRSKNLSVNLSLSIPVSTQHILNDGKSTSSSSDTTISDPIFNACENSTLSS